MNTSQSIMNDQHRATDSEWYCLEARTCGDKSDVPAYSCILELRDRIKALEAAVQPPKPNYPEIPDSSLIKRIKSRMIKTVGSTWEESSASILVEIAAWLREQGSYGHGWAAITLEQEAKR